MDNHAYRYHIFDSKTIVFIQNLYVLIITCTNTIYFAIFRNQNAATSHNKENSYYFFPNLNTNKGIYQIFPNIYVDLLSYCKLATISFPIKH